MEKNRGKFRFTTNQIAVLGVMMALGLMLSRFSILLGPSNRLSFGFIANAMIGILYGPWVAGFASAGNDLLKTFLFGVQGGDFFIGFTFTAFVGSFIYGYFLHREEIKWYHILLATVLNAVFTNLVLNTLWINLLYKTPVSVLLAGRIPQNVIMTPVRFLIIYLLSKNKQLNRIFARYATWDK